MNQTIHFGFFGGLKRQVLNDECIASWEKFGYNLKEWKDEDLPEFPPGYRMPILKANYFKYWVLSEHGGYFLDNDVQLLKPLPVHDCFLAFQRDDTRKDCINTAVMGATAGHEFLDACLDALNHVQGTPCPIWCGCGMPTQLLYDHGMVGLNLKQIVDGVMVYDSQAFYPWRWDEPPAPRKITPETFAIHHWQGSWKH